MATNTPNLNLLKKNPITEPNDTFNIDTMLNENWDKIDNADAENVKKTSLLEEIKQVDGENSGIDADMIDGKHASGTLNTNDKNNLVTAINEVDSRTTALETEISTNINQQTTTLTNANPTQHITAKQNCGVDVEVGGEMVVNLLGRDGSFETDSNGDGLADGIEAVGGYSGKSVSNGIQKFTADSIYSGIKLYANSIKANNKYYGRAEVKASSNNVKIVLYDGVNHCIKEHSSSGNFELLSNIITLDASATDNYLYIQDSRTSGYDEIQVKKIMYINLTDIFGLGNEPTREWCDANILYTNSAKPLLNPMVEVCGKNLVKDFISGNWADRSKFTLLLPTEIKLNMGGNVFLDIKAKPNTFYTIKSGTSTTGNIFISTKDRNGKIVRNNFLINTFTSGQTFSLSESEEYININCSDPLGNKVYSNIQLEQSTTATTYEPYKGGQIIFPIELAKIGTYQDKLTYKDGVAKVDRKVRHVVLDGSLDWVAGVYHSGRGFRQIYIQNLITAVHYTDLVINKFDGKVIALGVGTFTDADQAYFTTSSGYKDFFITISDTDSGWAEDYEPSVEEIKAYFNGWVMYGDSGQPYTGSNGTQRWAKRYSGVGTKYTFAGIGDVVEGSETTVLPTTINDQGYTPYQLYYALQQPIQEEIQPIILGDGVNLVEGQNTLSVKSGVVYQPITPVLFSDNTNYIINSILTGYENPLGYMSNTVAKIYKSKNNALTDDTSNWTQQLDQQTNYYGGLKIYQNKSTFDADAEYYILYEALQENYNCQVQEAEVCYEDNIRGTVNEAKEEISNNQVDISELQLRNVDTNVKGDGERIERSNGKLNITITNNTFAYKTVTFEKAFKENPDIMAVSRSGGYVVYVNNETPTGFDIGISRKDGVTGTYTSSVVWIAIGK